MELITNTEFDTLERFAAMIAKSGMGGFKTPEQAMVGLMLATAEGIPIGRVIHEYHIINGKLALKSEVILARFQRAGGILRYIRNSESVVEVVASHPSGGELSIQWTIERAKKAGLTANPTWQKHPAAMLRARAVTEAVRAVYPACLSGLIEESEAIEITATSIPLRPMLPEPDLKLKLAEASTLDELRDAWATVPSETPRLDLEELTAVKNQKKAELVK